MLEAELKKVMISRLQLAVLFRAGEMFTQVGENAHKVKPVAAPCPFTGGFPQPGVRTDCVGVSRWIRCSSMLLILHISASVCPKNHHLNCLRLLETSGSLGQVCTRHQRVYARSHVITRRQAVVSGWLIMTQHSVSLLSAGLRSPETVDLVSNVPILSSFAGQLGR